MGSIKYKTCRDNSLHWCSIRGFGHRIIIICLISLTWFLKPGSDGGPQCSPSPGERLGWSWGASSWSVVTGVPDVPDYKVLSRMSWFYLQQGSAVSVGRRSSSILKYARLLGPPAPLPPLSTLTAGNTDCHLERRDGARVKVGHFITL